MLGCRWPPREFPSCSVSGTSCIARKGPEIPLKGPPNQLRSRNHRWIFYISSTVCPPAGGLLPFADIPFVSYDMVQQDCFGQSYLKMAQSPDTLRGGPSLMQCCAAASTSHFPYRRQNGWGCMQGSRDSKSLS